VIETVTQSENLYNMQMSKFGAQFQQWVAMFDGICPSSNLPQWVFAVARRANLIKHGDHLLL